MIASDSMRKFRRWYQNYQAKHGTAPPRDMVSSFIRGEREAEISRANQSRALGLQEERLDIAKDQVRANERAATVSGVSQLGMLGVIGGSEIYDRWPKRTLTDTTLTGGGGTPARSSIPASTFASSGGTSRVVGGTGAEMGNPSSYGGVGRTPTSSSGLSTTAPTGTGTAPVTEGAGGLGTTGGMPVYAKVGLGVAAAGLGAEHERWGRKWHKEKFGKSGGRMSNVAARTGQGALIGASLGGGYGAAAGTGVGFVYGMEEEYHVTENVLNEFKGWFS